VNETLSLVITGMTIGFAYAAVPGAVNTEAMRRTLGRGPADGFSVQAGSLVGDLLWAIIGLTGAVLLRHDSIAIGLALIGGGFLLTLAKSAIHSAIHGPGENEAQRAGTSLKVGITFGLANPAGIAFWSGLGAGTLNQGGGSSIEQMLALVLSFGLGALVWGIFMVALIGYGRRFVSGRILRWIDGFCALVLSWFGIRLLWNGITRGWRVASPAFRFIT
jgi:chemosensory pili system protein ChpE